MCVCVNVAFRSSKKNLSLFLSAMSHVSDIFFPFGWTLKHKCVHAGICTQKKYASSPLQSITLKRWLKYAVCQNTSEREIEITRALANRFSSRFSKSKIRKGFVKRDLLINPGARIWKIRPRRIHRLPVQSFSSRGIPGENWFPVPSSRLPHWQSVPRNDHAARCTRVVMFFVIAVRGKIEAVLINVLINGSS